MGISGESKSIQVTIVAILLNVNLCKGVLDAMGTVPTKKPTTMPTFHPTGYPTITIIKNTNIGYAVKPLLVVVDEAFSSESTNNHNAEPLIIKNTYLTTPPTTSPSHKPSLKPSSHPTVSPSSTPTKTKSANPSGAPSMVHSTLPTSSPSISVEPTIHESEWPTSSAIPTITPSPTTRPSTSPTHHPSEMHSSGPSYVPSIRPSVYPTWTPTENPTMSSRPTGSSAPSYRPSRSPSFTPSGVPTSSGLPTFDPSAQPSDMPSLTPTTSVPSSSPSAIPSYYPSFAPSLLPSQSPSSAPSSSPTLTCHDKKDYRSPINSLTCADHRGTNCYQWRNIGLNTSALGDLINNCPETCHIPCGSFVNFSIPVSYQLTGLPGLLDDLSKLSLEQASFDYILDYVSDISDHIFELDNVELNSQSFGIHERRLRRNLQEEINKQVSQKVIRKEIVVVTVVFEGFSIGMSHDTISEILVSGIKSAGFTLALQGSDPFFKKAVISSAAETTDTSVHEPVEEEREGPSSASVLVTIFTVIGLVTILMFAHANRERIEAWWIQKRLHRLSNHSSDLDAAGRPRIVSIDMIGRGIPESNLERAVSRIKAIMAKLRPNKSDDLQKLYGASSPRQNSASQASRVSHQGSPNNVASLLSFDNSTHTLANGSASNSIRRLITSSSIPPAGSKSSTEPDDSSASVEKEDNFHDELRPSSPMSEVTEESNQAEHPLSKVIPPMIVIDNIEDGPSAISYKKGEPKMVPSKRVEASSAIKSALAGQSTSPVLMLNFPELHSVWQYDEIPHSDSPLGLIMDSESEAGTSYASTPANSVTQLTELSRFGALGGNDIEKNDPVLSPLHLLAMHSSPSSSDNTFDFALDAADDISIELVDRESSSEQHPGLERVGLINSIWAMGPGSAMKETLLATKKAASVKTSQLKRRFSNSSDQVIDSPSPVAGTGSPGSAFSNRFMFEAPRTSKLGLEIDSKDESGSFVHAVKEYSPLFGQIKTGDKICEIDGRDQQGSNPREIMQLLSSKHRRRVSSGSMKIVIERSASTGGTQ